MEPLSAALSSARTVCLMSSNAGPQARLLAWGVHVAMAQPLNQDSTLASPCTANASRLQLGLGAAYFAR